MRTALLAGLIACLLLTSCSKKKTPAEESAGVGIDTIARTGITFILGKDDNPRNPYYALADDYYRMNDSEKTETVIDTIYTLSGVLDYLAHNRPTNGRPWRLINLVSHGNEFIDLSVVVSPGGPRVSEESIQQAISDTVLRPLDTTIVDSRTRINLHGCAVGKNIGLLRMLGIAFGGKTPLQVRASRMFEYYGNLSDDNNPQFVKHYYARVWYVYHKPDSIPSDDSLARMFKTQYPTDDVNWAEAVQRYHPSNPSEEYHLRMVIPVSWEDFYETKRELPDVRTTQRQNKWIEDKPQFQALMDKTNIPRENFVVKFYNASYKTDSGDVYSLRVKARAGVVCVIKPVLKRDSLSRERYPPYLPAADDTVFFGFAERNSVRVREVIVQNP